MRFGKYASKHFFYIQNGIPGVLLNRNLSEEKLIKRTSITLEDPVYEAGQQIAAKRGFGQSFSAYIAWLIKRDAEGGVTREDATFRSTARTPGKATKAAGSKPAKRSAKRGK